jgi:hypothetical protein
MEAETVPSVALNRETDILLQWRRGWPLLLADRFRIATEHGGSFHLKTKLY